MDAALIEKIREIIDDQEKFDAVADVLEAAEQERKEKQRQGISRAQANGVRFGRPPAPVPEDFPSIYQRYKEGSLTSKVRRMVYTVRRVVFSDEIGFSPLCKYMEISQELFSAKAAAVLSGPVSADEAGSGF